MFGIGKTTEQKELERTQKELKDITEKANSFKARFELQMQIEQQKFEIEKLSKKLENPRAYLLNQQEKQNNKKTKNDFE